MRVIDNPTEEDKKSTSIFDPDKLPVCPNCEDDMLRYKKIGRASCRERV